MNQEKDKDAGQDYQPIVESYTFEELAEKLDTEADGDVYYCVDTMRDPRTRHKLIDPRSVLNAGIVRRMYENWSYSRDSVIRVTQDLDALMNLDEGAKSIAEYAAVLHHYLMRIFTRKKTSYKPEVQGLVMTAVEMLNTVFSYDNIAEVRIGPEQVRSFSSYYDHLVNTAVYWLAAMAALNRKNEQTAGSIEVWRSRDKAELRRLAGPYGEMPKQLVTFYDIYGFDNVTSDLAVKKKGDLSLITSGFFGAMFHDLGLLAQPAIVPSPESGKVSELLLGHADASNAALKDKLSILYDERPLTRSIIKNHHETLDGDGYPKKITNPHMFAQLVGVCDTYDELIASMPRGKVIHGLVRAAGRKYEGDAVRAFLAIVQPYAVGEQVDVFEEGVDSPIMSGEICGVENRFKPAVRVTTAHQGTYKECVGAELDLGDEKNAGLFV